MEAIQNIIKRAESLRNETAIGSVTPARVGSIMSDTLKIINEYQVSNGSLAIQKVYVGINEMMQDAEPISDLTGRSMKIGQLASVLEGPEAGSIYRFMGTDGITPLWEYLSRVADFQILYQQVLEAVRSKANQTGTYPDLIAGDLAGRGESVSAEFSFRVSGGKSIKDGSAYIKELQGNAVVWNQQLKNAAFSSSTYWNSERSEFLVDAGVAYIKATESFSNLTQVVKPVQGHSYLILVDAKGIEHRLNINFCSGADKSIGRLTSNFSLLSAIFTCGEPSSQNCQLYVIEDNADWAVKRIKLIDLTQMFGAGNEPTTIEEYNARKPIVEDEYAYNEGEVIPFTAEGIKSIGDNAWDEEWEKGGIDFHSGEKYADANKCRSSNFIKVLSNEEYYLSIPSVSPMYNAVVICYDSNKQFINHIGGGSANAKFITPLNCQYIRFTWVADTYNNDICISLAHSGYKEGQYFPYEEDTKMLDPRIKEAFPSGMMPWDKVYNKNGKGYIVKGSGSVDMGTLEWLSYKPNGTFTVFYTGANPFPAAYSDPGMNVVNQRYVAAKKGAADFFDRECRLFMQSDAIYPRFYVRDDAYTDAASFKAAMNGVILYYELAEPTILEYDEPFNLDYLVWDFGTEEIIAEQPSAPLKGNIIYQFNAVDQIRENYNMFQMLNKKVQDLEAKIETLLAIYSEDK